MLIVPSMLAANPAKLGQEVERVERAGADWIHWDVMDGHFVPNLTFGPHIVAGLRPLVKIPFDVHLMCTQPEILLEPYAQAGANGITVHAELGSRVESLIWKIKALKCKVGLAINPPTPMTAVEPYLKHIDLLLIMTVNPGFGGQSFIHEVIPKIQLAYSLRAKKKLDYHIEVDGGINMETIRECTQAGADTIVSGSSLFKQTQLKTAIRKMRETGLRHQRHQQLLA